MTTINAPLLPAVRRARAEALLALIDRDGSDQIDLDVLSNWLVKQYRGDSRTWTARQLEAALDDLAGVGAITVSVRGSRGTLVIDRQRGGVT